MEGDSHKYITYTDLARISIHALRVEGDSGHGFHVYYLLEISIHALRVEGDFVPWLNSLTEHEFLSTPSGWRATATSTSHIPT